MANTNEDLNLYFESLSDKELAYLELLETKHAKYLDNYSAIHNFNPIHKQSFINNHLAYLDGNQEAEYRRAIDYYADAKYNSLVVFGGTLATYCLYKLGTTPKTSKMSKFAVKGTLLGFFAAGIYMAYEHNRLTNTLSNLFVNVVQKKIKERTTSKLN